MLGSTKIAFPNIINAMVLFARRKRGARGSGEGGGGGGKESLVSTIRACLQNPQNSVDL